MVHLITASNTYLILARKIITLSPTIMKSHIHVFVARYPVPITISFTFTASVITSLPNFWIPLTIIIVPYMYHYSSLM